MATFRTGTVNSTSYSAAANAVVVRTIVAGDMVVVPVTWENSQTISPTTFTDSVGATYLVATQASQGDPSCPIAGIAYCLSHPGGTDVTITVPCSGTAAAIIELDAMCFTPAGGTTFALDGVATPGSGAIEVSFTAGAITTTGPGVVVQFVGGYQLTAGVAVGGTPTFTRDTGTENNGVGRSFAQYLLSGSAQTVTPGASWGAAGNKYVMVAAAFKEVAAGGSSTPRQLLLGVG